jgi:hypothetical protein
MTRHIGGLSRASAQQLSITPTDLAALPISVPPFYVQERIAALLREGEAAYRTALVAAAQRREVCVSVIADIIRNYGMPE